jgi:hypothetical protein
VGFGLRGFWALGLLGFRVSRLLGFMSVGVKVASGIYSGNGVMT